MKQQTIWQEQGLNIRSQDLNQPVASHSELPKKSGQGLDERKTHQTMGIH
jgi:hypothetical protein